MHAVHKTANFLTQVALSVRANMNADPLREVYGAPTRAAAEAAIEGRTGS